jgi:flagellar biosynthesis/type III secretory pathway protein FliH
MFQLAKLRDTRSWKEAYKEGFQEGFQQGFQETLEKATERNRPKIALKGASPREMREVRRLAKDIPK